MKKIGFATNFISFVITILLFAFPVIAEDNNTIYFTDTAEKVLDKFMARTSYLADIEEYQNRFDTVPEWVEESYISENIGTIEEWDAMTDYERYAYMELCAMPRSSLIKRAGYELTYLKQLFMSTPNTGSWATLKFLWNEIDFDTLYNAYAEVMEWHWNNWETQIVFIDIFSGKSIQKDDKATTESDTSILDEDNLDIITNNNDNLVDVIQTDDKKDNNILDILFGSIISVGILIVTIVVFLIIRSHNNKKNYFRD